MEVKNSLGRTVIIHHSDRVIQYVYNIYKEKLDYYEMLSSMTKGGSPQENAVAERVNGILKTEYNISSYRLSHKQCKTMVKEAIYLYNNERPHWSLKMKTPNEVYNESYENENNNNM